MKSTFLPIFAAIGILVSTSLPAAAVGCPDGQSPDPNGFGCVPVNAVPEPTTLLVSSLLGGSFLGKKFLDSRKASK